MMSNNIFITYGDDNFYKSRKRICKEAKKTNIFNKIVCFKPHDLPQYVKASPLFGFARGGGYWVWKPYIIYETLRNCKVGDVVWYVDAGCSINPTSKEWMYLQNTIKQHNGIFFQYRDNVNYKGWENFCKIPSNNNPKMLHWTKPSVIRYFCDYFGSDGFLKFNQIPGGFIIIKKTDKALNIINEWYNISLFKPEFFCDPFGRELEELPATFNGHRHDQTILALLIWRYRNDDDVIILPETLESGDRNEVCVVATRIHTYRWLLKDHLRYWYDRIINIF